MGSDKLHPQARVAFMLAGLYNSAEALCQIFVNVYLWRNSQDLNVLCKYYLALYAVTPVVFLLAGWYSKVRDRLHVYRLGILFHAVYYATLLILRERSAEFTVPLGILLGVTWGMFWAGANTINYDVTTQGRREYFIGLMNAISHVARMFAPLLSGFIIYYHPGLEGYHLIFAIVLGIYCAAFLVSHLLTPDQERTPFKIRRALFPGRDQWDWRYILLASFTLAGTFEIPTFLLSILMYVVSSNELNVGTYASAQALIAIIVSFYFGRLIMPESRRTYLLISSALLAASGIVFFFPITLTSLIVFGILRSASMALFGIGHFSVRMEVIMRCVEHPMQRIEYLSAWEIPLAFGRLTMMVALVVLNELYPEDFLGIRIVIIVLCVLRIATYVFLAKTSVLQKLPVAKQAAR
ncbi:MAG: hypothetical protein AMXMBFR4_31960 [Candidatus Hydrogenedentota bacterium]